jgi:hypothetical protein
LAPVRLKIGRKFAGSAPPLLKKALSALATLHWLTVKHPSAPRLALRFRITSVAV